MSSIQHVGSQSVASSDSPVVQSRVSGSYKSLDSGVGRTILALSKHDQELSTSDVTQIRERFTEVFGKRITDSVFRKIEGLQKKAESETFNFKVGSFRVAGTAVKGKDVQIAALAAMEQLRPGLKLHQEIQSLDKRIESLERSIGKLKQEKLSNQEALESAKDEQEQYGGGIFEYVKYSPHARDRINNLTSEIAKQGANLKKLEAELPALLEARSEAREGLEHFMSALTHPDALLKDGVILENQQKALESLIKRQNSEVADLERQIWVAEDGIKDRRQILDDSEITVGARFKAPGLMREIEGFQATEKSCREKLVKAQEALATSQEDLQEVVGALQQLKGASSFLRAQLMLDQVGGDPRFLECLNKVAPGKADGGMLGSLESAMGSVNKTFVFDTVVGFVLPPVGVGRTFYKAIQAENRERYLNVAKDQAVMKQYPLARSLASALSTANEQEKWKLGISGSLSFVTTAISLKLPGSSSALGALTTPLFSPLVSQIGSGANHALGSILGGLVEVGVESGLPAVSKKVVSKGVETGLGKVSESNSQSLEKAQFERALASLNFEDGQGLPLIPIRDSEGTLQFHSLSDPEIGVALLSYLGPAVNETLLGKADSLGENEQRRMALRKEIFGAANSEDFSPGKSTVPDLDKGLIEDFDSYRGIKPTNHALSRVSPLHLLCVSSGMVHC